MLAYSIGRTGMEIGVWLFLPRPNYLCLVFSTTIF